MHSSSITPSLKENNANLLSERSRYHINTANGTAPQIAQPILPISKIWCNTCLGVIKLLERSNCKESSHFSLRHSSCFFRQVMKRIPDLLAIHRFHVHRRSVVVRTGLAPSSMSSPRSEKLLTYTYPFSIG